MPEPIEVRKVPIHGVSDASELARLIDDGVMDASRVIAIIGKTEGNGGVNDYTRIIADRAFREVLVAKGAPAEQVKQVPIVWSGGTDGVISPHATIFATVPAERAEQSDEPAAHGGLRDERADPARGDRLHRHGHKVADAVKVAMERAGITDPADVHYVQTKTPLLTIHTIQDAKSRGMKVWTEHTHESMDLSNGTTGLGIAVALGEIEMPGDDDIMHNRSLFSSVASCSSGVELDQAQVVVVGNTRGIGGRYRIGHSVMRDALDADGIWSAIKDAGLELPDRPHSSDLQGRLVNVFLKCEVSQDGRVRGRRNAMLDDSDVHWHRQIKSCVGGVTAAVTGDPAVFVSVSAAHQGPDGGGPVAAIVDLGSGIPPATRLPGPPDLRPPAPAGTRRAGVRPPAPLRPPAASGPVGHLPQTGGGPRPTPRGLGAARGRPWCRCSSRPARGRSVRGQQSLSSGVAVIIGVSLGLALHGRRPSAAGVPARPGATRPRPGRPGTAAPAAVRPDRRRAPPPRPARHRVAPLALLLHRRPLTIWAWR